MASHQNAAKRLKALLRRTHFPVARLRQVQGAAVPQGGGGGGGGGGAGGNPWDGIVTGDPRAALIVLHWTLLDMSQLFSSHLLDRDYAGLQSLTDFKFVSTCLRMLRDEFNSRPQLTAEQFLTSGFAEVKMRLLAEIVELVMRTHHSLAQQQQGGRGNDQALTMTGGGHNPPTPISIGGGWGGKSDGGGSGTSSPWDAPTPPPHQQHSRPGSVESRGSGGGFSALSPAPAQPRSPPLLCGGPISTNSGGGSGGGGIVRHPLASSPSGLSDEQNAPPGGSAHRRVPLRSLTSVHAPVPRHHDWHNSDPRPYYNGGGGGSGAATGGGGGSSAWMRRPSSGDDCRGSSPQATGRSPLGPRSAQGPPHEYMAAVDLETAAATMGMLPPPLQCPPPAGSNAACVSTGRSDWLAVQQAFGSPSALHMPLPPAVVVPTSPPSASPMPKLPPRSASSVAAAAAHAAAISPSEMSNMASGGSSGSDRTASAFDGYARDRVGGGGSSFSAGGERHGCRGGDGGRQHRQQQDYDEDISLTAELGKMQRQIEAMLERHSRSIEGKIGDTEQILSARLTLLETKVHGLEIGSPLRT